MVILVERINFLEFTDMCKYVASLILASGPAFILLDSLKTVKYIVLNPCIVSYFSEILFLRYYGLSTGNDKCHFPHTDLILKIHIHLKMGIG